MKKFIVGILILIIISVIVIYKVNEYTNLLIKANENNVRYEGYYNEIYLGNQVVSILNETVDINNKNGITKDEETNMFIDNEKNSIHITVKFIYQDDFVEKTMEDITNKGAEDFMKVYGAAAFKCVEIGYHENYNNVKYIIFEEYLEEIVI